MGRRDTGTQFSSLWGILGWELHMVWWDDTNYSEPEDGPASDNDM